MTTIRNKLFARISGHPVDVLFIAPANKRELTALRQFADEGLISLTELERGGFLVTRTFTPYRAA